LEFYNHVKQLYHNFSVAAKGLLLCPSRGFPNFWTYIISPSKVKMHIELKQYIVFNKIGSTYFEP
jgi:hypothetical protein